MVTKSRFLSCFAKSKNLANGMFARFGVAGAEGIEPSARGFGDRCSTG